MASPRAPKSHSERVWTSKKALITHLYRIQDLPLKEVMDVMAKEHGFHASVKMYKNHITQWRIDKNNKAHEAQAIITQKQRRDQTHNSQQCLFFVRKFLVDIDSVQRFCKRSRIQPADDDKNDLPEDVQLLVLSNTIQNINDPTIFKSLRGFFHYYGVLVESSFEHGIWYNDNSLNILETDNLLSATTVEQSFLDLNTACQLFACGDNDLAFSYLNESFSRFRGLLRSTYHETVPCLIQSLTELQRNGKHDIVDQVLQHLEQLAEIVLPICHPYRGMLASLRYIDIDESGELLDAQSIQRKQLYLQRLNDDHLTVIGLGRFRYTDSGQKPEIRPWTQIKAFLHSIEVKYGKYEPRALAELDSICAGLYAAERFDRAEVMYEMLNERLGQVTYAQWVWKTLESSYRLGDIKKRLGKLVEAKEVWERAADLAGCLVQAHEYHWVPKFLEALANISLELNNPHDAVMYRRRLECLRARVFQQTAANAQTPKIIYDSGIRAHSPNCTDEHAWRSPVSQRVFKPSKYVRTGTDCINDWSWIKIPCG